MAFPLIIGSPPPQFLKLDEFCTKSCSPSAEPLPKTGTDCFCKPKPIKNIPPANTREFSPLVQGRKYVQKARELIEKGLTLSQKVEIYLSNPPPTIWFP